MKCLVRRPSPNLAEGLLTHIERQPVDPELALAQWEGYVGALTDFGWEPVEVPQPRNRRTASSSRIRSCGGKGQR